MEPELVPIGPDDLEELMALFLLCFRDDPYYQARFPGGAGLEAEARTSAAYCVETGGACGLRKDGRLIAFLLFFDYDRTRRTRPRQFQTIFCGQAGGALPHEKGVHHPCIAMGEQVLYLLSMGVDPDFRRQGLAGWLIDFLLTVLPQWNLVGDVSNSESLPLYRKRGFQLTELEPGYHFVCRRVPPDQAEACFANELIRLVKPEAPEDGSGEPVELPGYEIVTIHGVPLFRRSLFRRCRGWAVEVSYGELLDYQRALDLADVSEVCFPAQGDRKPMVLYIQSAPDCAPPQWGDCRQALERDHGREWSLIPDVHVMVPVEYRSRAAIEAYPKPYDKEMTRFFRYLGYRTLYEAGIPRKADRLGERSFKSRMERHYLGKLRVRVCRESGVEDYDPVYDSEGAEADVDLMLTLDKSSRCGVVSLLSYACPFLLSHLLDNVSKNLVLVEDRGTWRNLYDWLGDTLDLHKRGTAKTFFTLPVERSCLDPAELASLLMGECIYQADQGYGRVTDAEVRAVLDTEGGMGQYDRGEVYAYTNVLVQFCPGERLSRRARQEERSITFFYMELLLLEEAAIRIAEHDIVSCLTEVQPHATNRFLRRTVQIRREYTRTIEFWDIQMNYPSSRRSVSMLRTAFRLDEQVQRLERDSGQMQALFEAQRDVMDRTEAAILNYIVLILTLMQGIDMVFPVFFGGEGLFPGKVSGLILIVLLLLVYRGAKGLLGRGGR